MKEVAGKKGIHATFRGGKGDILHDLFPYLEGYSPKFITNIIDEYFDKPKNILEPFAGVGTTPITLILKGISCGYCEVNPFLIELIERKLFLLNNQNKRTLIKDLTKIKSLIQKSLLEYKEDIELKRRYVDVFNKSVYFPKENFIQILKLKTFEKTIPKKYQSLFTLLVSTVILKASNLKKAGDVRFKTKKELEKPFYQIDSLLIEKIEQLIRDLDLILNINGLSRAYFLADNAKDLKSLTNLDFDGVITSPPYLNGTNYIRNTKLELWYMEKLKDKRDLRRLRNKVVTSAINDVHSQSGKYILEEVRSYYDLISETTYDKRIPKMIADYFNHMKEVIIGLSKHVKRNGAICLDIGDSIYAKTHIPTHEILSEIAANNNLVKKDEIVLRKRYSNDGTELSQRLLVFINEK